VRTNPPLSDWFELAPLYLLREAHDRGIHLAPPPALFEGLHGKLLVHGDGTLTHYGRRRLNAFLDALGIDLATRRAVVRRLAARLASPTP
jgi:hypothetical protein